MLKPLRITLVGALAAAVTAAPLLAEPGNPTASAAAPPAFTASLLGTVLTITDVERELGFYRDGLGMNLAMTLDSGTRREYMLRFSSDQSQPGIILVHDSAKSAPAKIDFGNGFSRLVIRVSDINVASGRLAAAGYDHGEIRDVGHGYRMMMASDPQGYKLELVQSAAPR